jgi:thiol-disulfide isomerase/thioredoxin
MKAFRLCLLFITICAAASAQERKLNARDSMQLPAYMRFPTLPAFNLLLQDSVTEFNTYNIKEGRPTVLFFFSPDCEHCQITTKALMSKMDSMKGADFYMFSFMPLSMLRTFAKEYHLDDYPNILVAKDNEFFFPSFYKAQTVPYLVVYDRHKKLVKLWNGTVKVPELIKVLNSL